MRLKNTILSLCLLLGLAAVPLASTAVYAADPVDVFKQSCKDAPQGPNSPPICKEKELGGKNPLFGPDGILTKAIGILSIVVAIGAIIGIMLAGLKFITAGSNPQEVSSARSRVLYAVVALMIAASAQVLVRFILYKIG